MIKQIITPKATHMEHKRFVTITICIKGRERDKIFSTNEIG